MLIKGMCDGGWTDGPADRHTKVKKISKHAAYEGVMKSPAIGRLL